MSRAAYASPQEITDGTAQRSIDASLGSLVAKFYALRYNCEIKISKGAITLMLLAAIRQTKFRAA